MYGNNSMLNSGQENFSKMKSQAFESRPGLFFYRRHLPHFEAGDVLFLFLFTGAFFLWG